MTNGPASPGSFYGRRKGKQLRAAQSERLERLLPELRIVPPERWLVGRSGQTEFGAFFVSGEWSRPVLDPATLFPSAREVWLEIGFGGGEHLAHQARSHPAVGFLGVEPFVNGVTKLLAAVETEGLGNIRLWDRDAAELLPLLPPASLDRVYLLYPDPWPKRRQRKRRFISEANLSGLARVMRPGAELRFATDIDDYAGWTLARAAGHPDFAWDAASRSDWVDPWAGWPGTRYEAKARREGRGSAYLTFRRV